MSSERLINKGTSRVKQLIQRAYDSWIDRVLERERREERDEKKRSHRPRL